jgi:perosamine synthetase
MIPWAAPAYWGNEERYVADALRSTWISGGPFVDRLERDVAALCAAKDGERHALATSNGTTALQLPCIALGIGPGDEVIVPGFAFMAGANVALQLRARPVFCEVDPHTWCATAADVERCLSPRTKAIIVVHTYGNVCDMEPLLELAHARGIALIEDAAEAFGSRHRGRLAGTMAPIGTFSFHATKTITTGEGGMTLAADAAFAARMRLYRSHGMDRSKAFYWHEVAGHNFRLTNLQAALGCAQLEHLDDIVRERRRVHDAYRGRLDDLQGIVPQQFAPEVTPVLWAYALKVDLRAYPQGRDALVKQFAERGIETRPGFHPASEMRHLYSDCPPLPVCEELGRSVISLPTYPALKDAEIDRICDALKALRR